MRKTNGLFAGRQKIQNATQRKEVTTGGSDTFRCSIKIAAERVGAIQHFPKKGLAHINKDRLTCRSHQDIWGANVTVECKAIVDLQDTLGEHSRPAGEIPDVAKSTELAFIGMVAGHIVG